ncbi:MAG: sulfurtransferase complex subunit TusC [Halieaceae bacterium]
MQQPDNSTLLVFRQPPYGQALARAGYDLALAAAAFDQPISLLFMDDGVWQLLPEQDPSAIEAKSVARTLDSLPLYDIDSVYVETASLVSRGLSVEQLRANVLLLDDTEVGSFINGFGQVITF